jgi:hypothetical protein
MSEVLNKTITEAGNLVSGVGSMLGRATGFEQFQPDLYNINQQAFMPGAEEQQLTQALLARSQGMGGPSPAQLQMQAAIQQQGAQAQGLAASQRGMNPALAARQAQRASAMAGANAAQQGGILRAQETLGAQQLAQQGLQSQRAGRMAGEQLQVSRSATGEGLRASGYETAADRAGSFFRGAGSAMKMPGMASGGVVDGKAPVDGDSTVNDVVPAMLSPGEIVIPRSIAHRSPEEIAQFVMALRGGF